MKKSIAGTRGESILLITVEGFERQLVVPPGQAVVRWPVIGVSALSEMRFYRTDQSIYRAGLLRRLYEEKRPAEVGA